MYIVNKSVAIPDEVIISKIYVLRGHKVMLDSDLGDLYSVETKRLNEQVNRNTDRSPDDFMFKLTETEFENLKSQNATSSWGGRRKLPYAFTEHGVLMLSSVLSRKRAIAANIQIMRIFIRIRKILYNNKEILLKLEQLERQVSKHDQDVQIIFAYIKKLLNYDKSQRMLIGFKTGQSNK